ncbi:MAG TPA: hypothetical protein VGM56_22610 [Byssovorax sp.]|jgi:hypothetical protein
MKNAFKFVSALFLTAGMVVACASGDTSSTSNGGNTSGGNSSGDNTPEACKKGTDACTKCGDDSCCDQLEACDSDTKCKALSSCVAACIQAAGSTGDPTACENNCPNVSDMATVNLYNKTATCEETSCKQQCLCTSDGTSCGDCETSKCCDTLAACELSTDCLELDQCVGQCGASDQNCVNSCAGQFPNGVTPLNSFFMCLQNSCATPCGG